MVGKKPICKLSRSKAPERSKLAVTDIRQKPVDFSSCNNSQNLGSFAKVSIPGKICNSLVGQNTLTMFVGAVALRYVDNGVPQLP